MINSLFQRRTWLCKAELCPTLVTKNCRSHELLFFPWYHFSVPFYAIYERGGLPISSSSQSQEIYVGPSHAGLEWRAIMSSIYDQRLNHVTRKRSNHITREDQSVLRWTDRYCGRYYLYDQNLIAKRPFILALNCGQQRKTYSCVCPPTGDLHTNIVCLKAICSCNGIQKHYWLVWWLLITWQQYFGTTSAPVQREYIYYYPCSRRCIRHLDITQWCIIT